ncbi:glycoside hydrolase [Seiridium cupressi]
MGIQLPDEALGTVVGVLVFSVICLVCTCLMIWLVWTHHERDSFVGLMAYFTFLSTMASIIQQLHTMIWWTDVKTAQWEHLKTNVGSVEVAIAGPSVGLDLVLFYIQYFAYNVEALLTLCWAGALVQSIFGFADIASFKRIRHRTNAVAKVIAILLPATLISLLRVPSVLNNFTAFIIVANINMMISLTLGAILLLFILGKYIHTRRQLLSWNVQYGNSTRSQTQSQVRSGHASRNSVGNVSRRSSSIYDRWLMTRFAITFVMLSIFELLLILFQVSSTRITIPDQAPDLSAAKAQSDFVLFMPGCLPSVLLFVVFGTTTPFREHMKKTFLPKRFQTDNSGTEILGPVPHSSQNRKQSHLSLLTEDGPLSPNDSDSIIRLREVDLRESTRKDDDEWPILSTVTRVNGAHV